MIFGGAIQMDTGWVVLLVLLVLAIPIAGIAGLVILLNGLAQRRRSGGREGTAAIAFGLMLLAPIAKIATSFLVGWF